MKMRLCFYTLVCYSLVLFSCDKGYEIRCSNYFTEPMDTVKIGDNIIFTNVGLYATSEYKNVKRGQYDITFISSSKMVFSSSVFIPGKGEGKRTVQIDAAKQISILEE
jgi:hypothetical protein